MLPLLSLVAPEWMSGFAESLLAQKRMNGHLPDRVRNGSAQTGSTLAPALPVLASMVATGAPGVEPARILPSMLKDVSIPKGDWPWADFQALGYFPYDRVDGRSVLLTLEASRAHRAVAGVAAVLGDRDVAAEHATRTLFYRQLFRAEAVRFCARNHLGTWRAECTLPTDVGARNMNDGQRAAEAALWAPARFDVDGLITLLGGRQALAERLALLFDAGGTGTDPGIRYEHDDPGLHHVPWLFAYSNSPERTVSVVRRVLETAGPVTTESVEQSAWRVFAILGFYPVLHGQGEYVLGTPLVTEARIETGDRVLRIERGVADTPGVTHPISLDGVPLPGRTLGHRRLTQGSILRFVGSNPGNP